MDLLGAFRNILSPSSSFESMPSSFFTVPGSTPSSLNVEGLSSTLPSSSFFSLSGLTNAASSVQEALTVLSPSEISNFQSIDSVSPHAMKQRLQRQSHYTTLLHTLKQILAAHFLGKTIDPLLPDIVNTLSSKYLEVKRLVYVVLNQIVTQSTGELATSSEDATYGYSASTVRDISLLSINAFQTDLKDRSHLIRSAALRCITSLPILEIQSIAIHAVQRAIGDTSPYVRKTAVLAIYKLCCTDTDQLALLRSLLMPLFLDMEVSVLSSAVLVYSLMAPLSYSSLPLASEGYRKDRTWKERGGDTSRPAEDREAQLNTLQSEYLSLLHPYYRKLCDMLVYLEPTAQAAAIDLLLRYCRCFFAEPQTPQVIQQTVSSYKADPQFIKEAKEGPLLEEGDLDSTHTSVSKDFQLFLSALRLLLHSQSRSVVIAAATAILHLAPAQDHQRIVMPLLRCCHSTTDPSIVEIVLTSLLPILECIPSHFQPYCKSFYLYNYEANSVKQKKLEILEILCFGDKAEEILAELQTYVFWVNNNDFTAIVMQAITRIILRLEAFQVKFIKWMIHLLDSEHSKNIVGEIIISLRTLMQQTSNLSIAPIVAHFVDNLYIFKDANVRASIIWIIANYQNEIPYLIPDTLRILAKGFNQEAVDAKLQILSLALKVWSFHFFNITLGKLKDVSVCSKGLTAPTQETAIATQKPSIGNVKVGDTLESFPLSYPPERATESFQVNEGKLSVLFNEDETRNATILAALDKISIGEATDAVQVRRITKVINTADTSTTAHEATQKAMCIGRKHVTLEESISIFDRIHALLLYICQQSSQGSSVDTKDKARLCIMLVEQALATQRNAVTSQEQIVEDASSAYSDNASEDERRNLMNKHTSSSTTGILKRRFQRFCLQYLRELSLPSSERPAFIHGKTVVDMHTPAGKRVLSEKSHLNRIARFSDDSIARCSPYSISFLIGDTFNGYFPLPKFATVSTTDTIREAADTTFRQDTRNSLQVSSMIASTTAQQSAHKAPLDYSLEDLEKFYSDMDQVDPSGSLEDAVLNSLYSKEYDKDASSIWNMFGTERIERSDWKNVGTVVVGEDDESEESAQSENDEKLSVCQEAK